METFMEEKFDAIIVGAGLAGLSAAIKLAREGLQVVLMTGEIVRIGGKHLDSGALEELTLTTNGSQLAKYAKVRGGRKEDLYGVLARSAAIWI